MELESLKKDWKRIGPESDNKRILSDTALSEITRRKLKINAYKVIVPKMITILPYIFGAIFLLVFRRFFDSQFTISLTAVAVVICLAIPVINLVAIFKYRKRIGVTSSINETLLSVQKQGKQFIRLQYAVGLLNMLLVTIFIVLVPLVYSENLTLTEIFIAQCVGLMVVAFFSYRIWKYYKRIIDFNIKVLKELL